MLKKHALILSISYSMVLLIVCLARLDLDQVRELTPTYADKIFHFLAYFVLSILWFNSFYFIFNKSKQVSIVRSLLFSAVFGILIEVLQSSVTTSRTFDVKDIIANFSGMFVAALLIANCNKFEIKKY